MVVAGALAAIAIIIYIIVYFRKGKGKAGGTSQDALFDYLVKEIEGDLREGKVKEASSVYNRLNHVYIYVEKSKKASAKKKLDSLFNEIQAEKGALK